MDLINRARGLEKYTEAEMVKKLAKHYNLEIRFMVKEQDIKDKESLLQLLWSENKQDKNGEKQHTILLQGNYYKKGKRFGECNKDKSHSLTTSRRLS